MLEWQRDWAERDTYDAVMDIARNHFGAYGIGIEYAYTMVHGAAADKVPRIRRPDGHARSPVIRIWLRAEYGPQPVRNQLIEEATW